jgi:hypothetical protein
MQRFFGVVVASLVVLASFGAARADDQDAKAILDKAIKALGGEEKLAKAEAYSWKSKGTVNFGGNENDFTSETTIKGLDHLKREFGNDQFHGVLVVAGEKGWRHFGDNQAELEGDGLAGEKRNIYLQVIPITLVAIKGKGFKYEAAGEEKVGDKPAVALKITGPDGKDFKLFFDKDSGLPVKQVATVRGFQGDEVEQEATYSEYKDFGGIKKATKGQVKRNGEVFQTFELTEFKVLDKVAPETFTEPK